MPLYEYQCRACGARFERIQKFSDPPIDKCPTCGGDQVEKLISSPAIQFKGSGWYITDYARKSGSGDKAGKSSSDKGDKSDASSSASDAKSESKSESTTESKPAAETKSPAKTDSSKS